MKPFLTLLVALLVTAPALAGELSGVELPDSMVLDGQKLVLNGMALRKKAIFKVYVAGLYLPAKSSDADAVLAADAPRHLAMHWLRGVGTDSICGGWYDGLEANTPGASPALKAQFDELCSLMVPAESKQVLAFTYRPGSGTEVAVNGDVKGTIPGKAFADALWKCWIGPDPGPGQKFKSDLMGG